MGQIIQMKDHKKKRRKLKRLFGKKNRGNQSTPSRQQIAVTNQKRRSRRAGSIKWVFGILVLLLCLVGGYSFAQSSFFDVQQIVVGGNKEVAVEKIIELSGISKGDHIYKAHLERAKKFLLTNNWIEDVVIKRKLPDTIEINVKERVAIAAVPVESGIAIVDKNGFMINQQKLLDGLPLMIISGVDDIQGTIMPCNKIESSKLEDGLKVVLQMSEEAASMIAEINVKNSQNIVAYTTYGIDLILGDRNNFLEKYNVAKQIMQMEEEKGTLSSIEYIDVSISQQPTLKYLKNAEKKS